MGGGCSKGSDVIEDVELGKPGDIADFTPNESSIITAPTHFGVDGSIASQSRGGNETAHSGEEKTTIGSLRAVASKEPIRPSVQRCPIAAMEDRSNRKYDRAPALTTVADASLSRSMQSHEKMQTSSVVNIQGPSSIAATAGTSVGVPSKSEQVDSEADYELPQEQNTASSAVGSSQPTAPWNVFAATCERQSTEASGASRRDQEKLSESDEDSGTASRTRAMLQKIKQKGHHTIPEPPPVVVNGNALIEKHKPQTRSKLRPVVGNSSSSPSESESSGDSDYEAPCEPENDQRSSACTMEVFM